MHEKQTTNENKQKDLLPQFTGELLAMGGIAVRDLSAIVVCHGPGTFTGIRVGIAFALGLSTPFGVPVFAVSALECFARHNGKCSVAVQALKGTVYFQTFSDGKPETEAIHIEENSLQNNKNLQNVIMVDGVNTPFPSAKIIMERFFSQSEPLPYKEPLYIRPVNAQISKTKNIVQ